MKLLKRLYTAIAFLPMLFIFTLIGLFVAFMTAGYRYIVYGHSDINETIDWLIEKLEPVFFKLIMHKRRK